MTGIIRTFTGRQFRPLAPRVEDIAIEDIAHALAHQCRFSGHVRAFYSVAQHSVLASKVATRDVALWALLHDASEAYLVDLPRPLKELPAFAAYRAAEALLQRVIFHRFGLSGDMPETVHIIDDALLALEAETLIAGGAAAIDRVAPAAVCGQPVRILPVAPDVAERAFLKRFAELTATADQAVTA